jgi:glucosyl-3-phosphoglycerate phosphatase
MILLRHGQSEFNVRFSVAKIDPGIADPPLTELGHDQARQAATALAGSAVARIVCSPYTRALQTASVVASRLGVPILVNPMVRERYAFSCDIGTPRTELAFAWPKLDFSHLDEIWWPTQEEPHAEAGGRAARFRDEMAALPDWRDTLVVSHWGFILALTGTRAQNGELLRFDPTAPAPPGGAHPMAGPYLAPRPEP